MRNRNYYTEKPKNQEAKSQEVKQQEKKIEENEQKSEYQETTDYLQADGETFE